MGNPSPNYPHEASIYIGDLIWMRCDVDISDILMYECISCKNNVMNI